VPTTEAINDHLDSLPQEVNPTQGRAKLALLKSTIVHGRSTGVPLFVAHGQDPFAKSNIIMVPPFMHNFAHANRLALTLWVGAVVDPEYPDMRSYKSQLNRAVKLTGKGKLVASAAVYREMVTM
jgi:hypothetical protein